MAAAQILHQFMVHLGRLQLFEAVWYRPGIMYGIISMCFVCLLFIESLLAMAWVISTKWIVIGRRHEGSCAWDTHSYCKC